MDFLLFLAVVSVWLLTFISQSLTFSFCCFELSVREPTGREEIFLQGNHPQHGSFEGQGGPDGGVHDEQHQGDFQGEGTNTGTRWTFLPVSRFPPVPICDSRSGLRLGSDVMCSHASSSAKVIGSEVNDDTRAQWHNSKYSVFPILLSVKLNFSLTRYPAPCTKKWVINWPALQRESKLMQWVRQTLEFILFIILFQIILYFICESVVLW